MSNEGTPPAGRSLSDERGRLALTVGYDGSEFAGSQRQPGARTVQGVLEGSLAALFGEQESAVFAGRTDRGVHAVGQVVGCTDRRPDWSEATIAAAINARLPDDLAVLSVARRPPEFHARYDARWREYRYRVWSGVPQPVARRQVWSRWATLDPAPMAEAARTLRGTHDFATFAGSGDGVPWAERRRTDRGTVRTMLVSRIVEPRPGWGEETPGGGRLIEVVVAADGFLPQMVRNIVGALVEVGRGARPPGWMDDLLRSRDRRAAGATAPPHGLVLWRVGYGDEQALG